MFTPAAIDEVAALLMEIRGPSEQVHIECSKIPEQHIAHLQKFTKHLNSSQDRFIVTKPRYGPCFTEP
uniref:Uncharacterized protein n=2 Tax=Oryza TaxID=4527 RepID=A0A0E0NPZ4_ORYRU